MRNSLLTALLIFLPFIGSAQERFDEIRQEIEQKARLNLWDDILILAPDLIIEDFSRGDGYYYTALAFQRKGNNDLANKYLLKAKPLADDELSKKISQLESDMHAKEDLKQYIESAQRNEQNRNKAAAAEAWYKAWQLDVYSIEYALSAIAHYIDLKNYEKALEILRQPQVAQDPLAKELAQKINNTPEMTSINEYNSAIADGDRNMTQGYYESARDAYEKALRQRPSDSYAKSKKAEAIEEMAWEKARKSSYVRETESYADTYPYGKHIDRANEVIKSSYNSIAKKASAESDVKTMIEFYDKYRRRYPGDDGVNTIRNLLLNYYLKTADYYMEAKGWYTAKPNYESYLALNPVGETADYCRKQIKKCEWKLKQTDRDFIAYSYDSMAPLGMSFGYLNSRGVGWYGTLKISNAVFNTLDGTIDDDGNYSSDAYSEAVNHHPRNITRTAVAAGSFGLTIKVAYPFFLYAGGGVMYSSVYEEWEATDPDYVLQNVDRYYWLKNTDHTGVHFFPEGGVILKVYDAMVLKYGIVYRGGIVHQFGIGFQFE